MIGVGHFWSFVYDPKNYFCSFTDVFVHNMLLRRKCGPECIAGGYYSGSQDHFMSSLAAHILSQRNQLSTPACGALWREAVEVGEHFSKTGKARPSDTRVITEATNFSNKIYDGITKLSGL